MKLSEIRQELNSITGDFHDILHLDSADVYFLYAKVAKSGNQNLSIQDIEQFLNYFKNRRQKYV